MNRISLLLALLVLSSCILPSVKMPPRHIFEKVKFSEVDNWGKDQKMEEVVPSFMRTCKAFKNKNKDTIVTSQPVVTTISQWQEVCKDILEHKINSSNVQSYFENNFDVYLVGQKQEGFVTGYYHIHLKGSREKTKKYKYPVYGVPEDLVKISVGNFQISNASVSKIVGRVVDNEIFPYHEATEIEEGILDSKANIIGYVASRLERYLLHVQGSGTLLLDDGSKVKLDYAEQNGHPFKGLSKTLVEKNYIERGNVNLETMMEVYRQYPEEMAQIILENKSYIFLKESNTKDVIGAMGVGLTPRRSVAIDSKHIAYGVPIWLSLLDYNIEDIKDINSMVVAQDRGGAIIGPNRLDFYWGEGDRAGMFAGQTKHKASVYILLPKQINIEEIK